MLSKSLFTQLFATTPRPSDFVPVVGERVNSRNCDKTLTVTNYRELKTFLCAFIFLYSRLTALRAVFYEGEVRINAMENWEMYIGVSVSAVCVFVCVCILTRRYPINSIDAN